MNRHEMAEDRTKARSVVPHSAEVCSRENSQSLIQAIAKELLERIADPTEAVEAGFDHNGGGAAQLGATTIEPHDEEPPALADFNLQCRAGRLGFLWALFHHHYRHGLLLAVNHAWESLAHPKAIRCQIMAQKLQLGGKGKKALKNVLAAFLKETLYGVEFPPLPSIAGFDDNAQWQAACADHFAGIDAKFEAIVHRYEAILDGRDPDARMMRASLTHQVGRVVVGPWVVPARKFHCTSPDTPPTT